jgi:predicted cation transporter
MTLPRDWFLSRHKHILNTLVVVLVLFVVLPHRQSMKVVVVKLVILLVRKHEVEDNWEEVGADLEVDGQAVDNYYNTEVVVDNLD